MNGHTFKLLDIAPLSCIEGRTIEDCTIIGPTMILMGGATIIQSCGFDAPPDILVVETGPNPRGLVGAILVKDTVFRRCHFRGIGFVGPDGTLEKIKKGPRLNFEVQHLLGLKEALIGCFVAMSFSGSVVEVLGD